MIQALSERLRATDTAPQCFIVTYVVPGVSDVSAAIPEPTDGVRRMPAARLFRPSLLKCSLLESVRQSKLSLSVPFGSAQHSPSLSFRGERADSSFIRKANVGPRSEELCAIERFLLDESLFGSIDADRAGITAVTPGGICVNLH